MAVGAGFVLTRPLAQAMAQSPAVQLGGVECYEGGVARCDNEHDAREVTALVRRVTELRIDAARYANPLTQLPGNIPITEHVRRLVETGQGFVACYCDLNHFKPYNDQYGYFLGDRMIQLVDITARLVGNALSGPK